VLEDDGAERDGVSPARRAPAAAVRVRAIAMGYRRQRHQPWNRAGSIIGNNEGDDIFTIPKRPVRRRFHGLPWFVTVRGGEHCLIRGLRALQWLSAHRPACRRLSLSGFASLRRHSFDPGRALR